MKYTTLITSVFLSSAAYSAETLCQCDPLNQSFAVYPGGPRALSSVRVPVETIGRAFLDGDQDLSSGMSFQGVRVQIAGRLYSSFIRLLVEAPAVNDAIRESYTVDDAISSLGRSAVGMRRIGVLGLGFSYANGMYSFSNEVVSVTFLPTGF